MQCWPSGCLGHCDLWYLTEANTGKCVVIFHNQACLSASVLSDCTKKLQIKILSMDEKILSMDKVFIPQNHPWMEKSYPEMKVSSMEKIMDNIFMQNFCPFM